MEATNAIFGWLKQQPVILTLLILTILDMITGIAAAFVTKKVTSDASLRGATRKAIMWMIVAVCAALERLSPDIALAKLACLFYCVTEIISIMENAGRAGVPIPPVLREALTKIPGTPSRESSSASVQTTATATATVATITVPETDGG